MKKMTIIRTAAAVLGGLALAGVAGLAVAEPGEISDEEVDVTVVISPLSGPGALTMTVAADSATLTEATSTDPALRQFTGVLPIVTVNDSRDVDDIPADVMWYVLGSASAFEGDAAQADIPAGNLGWSPRMIEDPSESGLVGPGGDVDTVLDTGVANRGLVDQEFLVAAIDSALVAEEEEWQATADLFLKTPATVEPGTYTSVLTLTLFENEYEEI
jgi:hypothetical protein